MRAPHSVFRRRVAAVTTAVVVASLLSAVASPQPAMAAIEPSVPLPTLKSTPVNQQVMEPRGRDEASDNALRGEQTVAGRRDDGGGTAKATSLAPSATWQVSPQTGDFTWSYPLRVPPAPGGLEPDLALSYASSAVDGRTSATNNQASWVGDGWDLSVGFIERGYLSCSDDDMGDVKPPKTMGDLCWRSNNATASYDGGAGQLICCDGQRRWRAKSDDGSRIELKAGVANGDDDGEHWVITAVDGTQYFFGSRPEAKSTWTAPVYGDDSNEPCHSTAGLTASGCVQAWRWNLDKVIDRNGNIMLYQYGAETNSYGKNGTETAVSYVRGGYLRSVEYGIRTDRAASAQVEFIPGDRCVPGSNCAANPAPANALNWPDVPWDTRCAAATCGVNRAPTFWSTKRLAKVVSRIRAEGGGFTDVDSWTLDHQFPQTGDGEQPALWLKSIVHTGHVGGASPLPPVTFQGKMMPNRVYKVNGLARLNRYRITGILSESGGLLSVNYADVNCVEGSSMPPNSHTNTLRCFQVTWTKKDDIERTEYFHKYVVESIVQSDRFPDQPTANMEQVTSYEYKDGAAWHYDTSEFTKDEKKTWDEFRGYGKVVIRTGDQRVDGAPVSKVEKRFYRGMHGDKLPSGTLAAQVTPSEGKARNDDDWLNGTTLETITYDGDTDTVVSKTIDTPVWGTGPTAVRDAFKAYQVRTGTSDSWTALAAGGWRKTKTESTYDDRGLVTKVNDLGDAATDADDRCIETGYARNSEKWLMSFPSSVETVSVACGVARAFPADAISDLRYSYDENGNVVETKALKERPATEPEYEIAGKATYDEHGRVKTTTDTYGKVTRTTYTPAKGGPTTGTVTTNPLGHTTTTTLNPAWGLPTTVVDANLRKTMHAYDALGRLTEVWLPNRNSSDGASVKVTYKINGDAPSVVTTSRINANGNYVTTKDIYDGLLRLRQSQAPAVGGGRLLTDTRYDSHGRPYKSTQPFFNNAAIDDKLWVASDVEIPGHTVTVYDGVDRVTNEIYMGGATERWRTVFTYGGDRVNVTPPAGGVATTTITDARGQVTEQRQYRGPKPEGVYDPTSYTYTDAGLLASVTDPARNTWRYDYDVRGNQIKAVDPDKGTATMTYDKGNRLETVTDARGTKLTHTYDDLGRKTLVAAGETELASWTYDTATKGLGQLATATSYVDDAPYTRSVASYSALYHPTQTSVTIPETPRAKTLAGTYTTTSALNADGTPYNMTLPEIGDLRKETVSWEYDELSNPTKLTGGPVTTGTFEYVTGTEYTGYGEAARIQLGQLGKRVWRSYYYDDHTRRLKRSIVDAEVPKPMQTDVNYTYDRAGNVTSIANMPKDLPHDVQCFRYDHSRRLNEAWTGATNQWDEDDGCTGDPTAAASPAPYWHSYTYDVAGNRLTETQHAAGGNTLREYNYPAVGAHRLDSVTTKAPGPSKTDRFTYDATGNTLTRPGQQLEWDQLGKLAQVSEGDKQTRFVYDADGGRLLREDPTSITLYLDGQDLKLTKGTGQLAATRYYQHGEMTVATRTAAGVRWEAGDHQDTAQVAIDEATQKVTQRRQTPFGAPRGTPVPWVGDKGFVGGTLDSSTGLTNLGARQYDPLLGRFLSVDPVIDPADPQQMHGYTYSNNNPVTYSDPTGLLLGFLKKVWNGIRTVAKHAAPVLGYAAMVLAATPIGGAVAIAALVAGGINTLGSCLEDKKALGCAAHAIEFAPGAGKLAVGAFKNASNALNRARYVSGLANTGRYRSYREMTKLNEQVGHLGSRPGQWLSRETIGEHSKVIEAAGYYVGTYYYTTCGLKTVDCYGNGASTAAEGSPEAGGTPQYVKWIQPNNYVELPKPFYRHDFQGAMLAGGTRAKNAAEWRYGPGGKWTNITRWAPPPTSSAPSPPPRRSMQGPNNTYTTSDGRVCNRGGGMCAI